jgi:sortase A
MALYKYVKQEPGGEAFSSGISLPKVELSSLRPEWLTKKRASWLLSIVGLVLVGNALIPIINYQFRYATGFGDKKLSPIVYKSKDEVLGAISAEAKDSKDYTLITSWFEEDPHMDHQQETDVETYGLSIPKLGIEKAEVKIGGEDLKNHLIHYPDTSLPGRLGNGVIFGHSVLPQFFNPENYLTIFSTLHRLKKGDEIKIEFDGVEYRYLVQDMYEVAADDLSVLEQRYDRRFLSLITCSPPGTYLRRLVIKAQIVE